MAESKTARKTIEVGRLRIPMRKLLHGKEIREAAKSLEDFRLRLNEQEFMYGAKITVHVDTYGEYTAVAKRLETDNELANRIEKARLAAEAKKEREAKRKIAAAEKAKHDEETRKARTIEHLKSMAKANGISIKDLLDT